jgi:AcrR family transcriptional regulator
VTSELGPRTHRGLRTRTLLREAARRTFAARGYAGARIEDIVADAGVSHGTFYTYFGNKAGVLDALIDVTSTELQAVVDEPWEGPDAPTTVQAVIDRFVAVFAEHGDVVETWLEAGAHDQHFRHRLRDVRAGYVRRVAEILEPVLADSPHRADDAAIALVAMVEGYVSQGLTDHDSPRRDEVVRTLSRLWFGGLLELAGDRHPA